MTTKNEGLKKCCSIEKKRDILNMKFGKGDMTTKNEGLKKCCSIEKKRDILNMKFFHGYIQSTMSMPQFEWIEAVNCPDFKITIYCLEGGLEAFEAQIQKETKKALLFTLTDAKYTYKITVEKKKIADLLKKGVGGEDTVDLPVKFVASPTADWVATFPDELADIRKGDEVNYGHATGYLWADPVRDGGMTTIEIVADPGQDFDQSQKMVTGTKVEYKVSSYQQWERGTVIGSGKVKNDDSDKEYAWKEIRPLLTIGSTPIIDSPIEMKKKYEETKIQFELIESMAEAENKAENAGCKKNKKKQPSLHNAKLVFKHYKRHRSTVPVPAWEATLAEDKDTKFPKDKNEEYFKSFMKGKPVSQGKTKNSWQRTLESFGVGKKLVQFCGWPTGKVSGTLRSPFVGNTSTVNIATRLYKTDEKFEEYGGGYDGLNFGHTHKIASIHIIKVVEVPNVDSGAGAADPDQDFDQRQTMFVQGTKVEYKVSSYQQWERGTVIGSGKVKNDDSDKEYAWKEIRPLLTIGSTPIIDSPIDMETQPKVFEHFYIDGPCNMPECGHCTRRQVYGNEFQNYRKSHYSWEFMVLFRKMFIASTALFLTTRFVARLLCEMAFNIYYFCWLLHSRPYLSDIKLAERVTRIEYDDLEEPPKSLYDVCFVRKHEKDDTKEEQEKMKKKRRSSVGAIQIAGKKLKHYVEKRTLRDIVKDWDKKIGSNNILDAILTFAEICLSFAALGTSIIMDKIKRMPQYYNTGGQLPLFNMTNATFGNSTLVFNNGTNSGAPPFVVTEAIMAKEFPFGNFVYGAFEWVGGLCLFIGFSYFLYFFAVFLVDMAGRHKEKVKKGVLVCAVALVYVFGVVALVFVAVCAFCYYQRHTIEKIPLCAKLKQRVLSCISEKVDAKTQQSDVEMTNKV
jgi:hypothetical protein